MRASSLLLSASVLALSAAPALAQTAPPPATQPPIPTIVVDTGRRAEPSHRFGDPLDSGTTTIGRDSIEGSAPGSGDVNQVLKALPTVQFSSTEGRADRSSLQDIRPSDISISGGSIYENLFVIDGVGVNSRMDVSGTNPQHFIEGNTAASAQTLWLDSGLIGSLTLRDSNVSAEYGQFMGGVFEIVTRAPGRAFGFESLYAETSSDLTEFVVSDRSRTALNGAAPQEPEHRKTRYQALVDLPISDRFRTLAAYTMTDSSVVNFRGANWLKYGNYELRSRKEELLIKTEFDLSADILLRTQFTWAPYESLSSHPNGIDNYTTSNGGGYTGSIELDGRLGEADWKLTLARASSDTDRDSVHPGTVNVSTSGGSGIDWCSGTSCSLGGPGILTQRQVDTTLSGRWEQPLGRGVLRTGFQFANIEGEKGQPYSAAYRHVGTTAYPTIPNEVNPNTVCAVRTEIAAGTCVDGRYALAQRNDTTAFQAKVDLTHASLWGEYRTDWAGFSIRAGLRYDYETFLGNHDISPRLAISHDLPWGTTLTVGANRYYSHSFLGYAMRDKYPGNRIYQRRPTIVGTQRIWSDNWYLVTHSETAKYSNADLSTPYNDELTAVLTGPVGWIGGDFKLKGILRNSSDQFSSSTATTTVYDRETGGTATRQVYTITNDGEGEYRGLSLEYLRHLGPDHALSFSANYSHTSRSNTSYFDIADETEFDGVLVYFRGKVQPALEVMANNQLENFASPVILNGDWRAIWFGGRLKTNVNVRWRDGFERIEDTGRKITVSGTRYDVYDVIRYGSSVETNMAASLEIARNAYGTALLDVRVNNLLNTVPDGEYAGTAQPYQLGRNIWVGLKYRY